MRGAAFLLVSLAAGPAAAQATFEFGSSPNPVGSGARALGLASAFIATADDATAASWNPAGLIALELPEASLVLSLKNRNEAFEGVGIGPDDEVQRYTYPGLNYGSVAYPFKVGSRFFVFALNFQSLIDFDKKVDKTYFTTGASNLNAEQRVSFLQQGSLRAVTPALAFQLSPYLSLGVAIPVWTDRLGYENGWVERSDIDSTVSIGSASNVVETSISQRERFSFDGVGANLGLLWDVTPAFTLGAVVKAPVRGALTHTLNRYHVSGEAPRPKRTYDEELRLPPSYGVGLAYRHSDALTLSADVYRIDWQYFRHEKFVVSAEDTLVINPIDARPYDDSRVAGVTQAHLGVERLFVLPRTVVPVRGGVFYDPEPTAAGTQHFVGAALGSGLSVGEVIFDAAYQFRTSLGDQPDVVILGDQSGDTKTVAAKGGLVWQHLFYLSSIYHF